VRPDGVSVGVGENTPPRRVRRTLRIWGLVNRGKRGSRTSSLARRAGLSQFEERAGLSQFEERHTLAS